MAGVEEYVVAKPITVTAGMNVYEAAHAILANEISGVVVVDENETLIGMLSELDCLRAMITSVYNGGDPGGALVKDIMTVNVEVNRLDDDILEVATSMLDHKHRRRPVLDESGKLTGQITCRQILRAVTNFVEEGPETG